MKLRVRISLRASRDINEIKDYLIERDPTAAEKVRQHILRAIDLVSEYPLVGPKTEISDVRVKLVKPFPYRIYYRVTAGFLDILHVRHMARQVPGPDEIV